VLVEWVITGITAGMSKSAEDGKRKASCWKKKKGYAKDLKANVSYGVTSYGVTSS